jgi:hypothetical protein
LGKEGFFFFFPRPLSGEAEERADQQSGVGVSQLHQTIFKPE